MWNNPDKPVLYKSICFKNFIYNGTQEGIVWNVYGSRDT